MRRKVIQPGPIPDKGMRSVSVRKIDNGYIVSNTTTGSGPKGYKETETFYPQKPDVSLEVGVPPKKRLGK